MPPALLTCVQPGQHFSQSKADALPQYRHELNHSVPHWAGLTALQLCAATPERPDEMLCASGSTFRRHWPSTSAIAPIAAPISLRGDARSVPAEPKSRR